MKITETLVAEHAVFRNVFDSIERTLPKIRSLAEIKLIASLVESMLVRHAEAENDIAFLAVDHTLAEQGHLSSMHEEHNEIDVSLKQVQAATKVAEAKRLLKFAMLASRAHFKSEERKVFPLVEKVLKDDTLIKLNQAY